MTSVSPLTCENYIAENRILVIKWSINFHRLEPGSWEARQNSHSEEILGFLNGQQKNIGHKQRQNNHQLTYAKISQDSRKLEAIYKKKRVKLADQLDRPLFTENTKSSYKKRQVLYAPTVESAKALCINTFPLSKELSWHCIIHTFTPHSVGIAPESRPNLKATVEQRGHSREWAVEIERDSTRAWMAYSLISCKSHHSPPGLWRNLLRTNRATAVLAWRHTFKKVKQQCRCTNARDAEGIKPSSSRRMVIHLCSECHTTYTEKSLSIHSSFLLCHA